MSSMGRVVTSQTNKPSSGVQKASADTKPTRVVTRTVLDVVPGDDYIRVEMAQGTKRVSLEPAFVQQALSAAGSGLVAASIAALQALDDEALPDGAVVTVASLSDLFYLDRESAVDLADTVVVAAASGTGRWLRAGISAMKWRQQAAWFIDAVAGNDENDGSEAFPLKTQAEWVRRVGRFPLVAMTMTFTADSAEDMIWDIDVDFNAFLTVKGTVSAATYTGTMLSVQEWSSALNQDGRFTDATMPVGAVGSYARMTSGDANGLVFWIAADLGANIYRYSYVVDLDLFEVVPPISGDTFTLHTITKLTGSHIFQPRGHGAQMLFQDLEFGTPGGGSHQSRIVQGDPIFIRCKTHGCDVQQSGAADALQCWWSNGTQARIYERGELLTFGGVVPTGMLVASGRYTPELTLLQGPITLEGPASLLTLNSSIAVFNAGGPALQMATMSRADLSWGRFFGAAAVGIQTGSWCQVAYDFVPSVTAATQLSFGGTIKTYAELPYFDTATQSGAVAWSE